MPNPLVKCLNTEWVMYPLDLENTLAKRDRHSPEFGLKGLLAQQVGGFER
jgi:hypothetical protein